MKWFVETGKKTGGRQRGGKGLIRATELIGNSRIGMKKVQEEAAAVPKQRGQGKTRPGENRVTSVDILFEDGGTRRELTMTSRPYRGLKRCGFGALKGFVGRRNGCLEKGTGGSGRKLEKLRKASGQTIFLYWERGIVRWGP